MDQVKDFASIGTHAGAPIIVVSHSEELGFAMAIKQQMCHCLCNEPRAIEFDNARRRIAIVLLTLLASTIASSTFIPSARKVCYKKQHISCGLVLVAVSEVLLSPVGPSYSKMKSTKCCVEVISPTCEKYCNTSGARVRLIRKHVRSKACIQVV